MSFCVCQLCFANSDLRRRALRRLLRYICIYDLCAGPFSVNIYLRQLFQYPLSTRNDDANVCTFRAHIRSRLSAAVAVYLSCPGGKSESRNPSGALSLSLSLAKKGGAAAAAAATARCGNVYTRPCISSPCIRAWVFKAERKGGRERGE